MLSLDSPMPKAFLIHHFFGYEPEKRAHPDKLKRENIQGDLKS